MIIYDLVCPDGHSFEGWFAWKEEFQRERKGRRLACPICGSRRIDVRPSGAHVGHGRTSGPSPGGPPSPPSPSPDGEGPARGRGKTLLAALAEAVERNFEDVGKAFHEEAMKIHCGEGRPRNIRGTMTDEEEKSLVEEGVEFSKLPLPRFQG